MSFIDSATDILDRTETSLNSLMADALKARAYRDIAVIAALAEQLAAIVPSRPGRRPAATEEMAGATAGPETAAAARSADPFWMRPRA